ncbi:MAG: hypothetical protein AAF891_00190 [Pseudomonadota bacterium]
MRRFRVDSVDIAFGLIVFMLIIIGVTNMWTVFTCEGVILHGLQTNCIPLPEEGK